MLYKELQEPEVRSHCLDVLEVFHLLTVLFELQTVIIHVLHLQVDGPPEKTLENKQNPNQNIRLFQLPPRRTLKTFHVSLMFPFRGTVVPVGPAQNQNQRNPSGWFQLQ